MDTKAEIAKLAYELYLNSGCKDGRDLDNWFEAERIILARKHLENEGLKIEDESEKEEKKSVMRSGESKSTHSKNSSRIA